MSKEKQIEEMAKMMHDSYSWVGWIIPSMESDPVYRPKRSMVIKRKIREARRRRGRRRRR